MSHLLLPLRNRWLQYVLGGALAVSCALAIFFITPRLMLADSPPFTDSDGDGMDDNWEIQHFGSVSRDGLGDYDGDSVADALEHAASRSPVLANPMTIGEAGSTFVTQNTREQWQVVKLAGYYSNPVVVAGPAGIKESDPITIRVRNVGATSFEIRIEEWEYLTGAHRTEQIHYMVLEAGTHTLADGTKLEAGRTTVTGSVGLDILYTTPFLTAPAVMAQVTTVNDPRPAVVRQSLASAAGVRLSVQNSEAQEAIAAHGAESVDWIAWETGQGATAAGPSLAVRTGVRFTHSFRKELFPSGYFGTADGLVLVAAMGTRNEQDTAGVRMKNLTNEGVDFLIEEEKSANTEVNHVAEGINFVALKSGPIQFIPTMADANGDGLPDAWQISEGLLNGETGDPMTGLSAFDISYCGDPDNDGFINREEYVKEGSPLIAGGFPGLFDRDKWTNLTGFEMSDIFASDKFYKAPDVAQLVEAVEGPRNDGNGYTSRLRGTVTIPTSGNWRFSLAADDIAELWISTDGSKFYKRRVAEVSPTSTGRVNYREWDRGASQHSEWFSLTAGQTLFVEVLHIEQQSHNHVSVAWERQGGNPGREVITGMAVLRSYIPDLDDADDDYLPDSWEILYGLAPKDNGSANRLLEGERGDFDGDGLTNHEEFLLGTNPAAKDTDGDGFSDAREVQGLGTNPLVSDIIRTQLVTDQLGSGLTGSSSPWLELSDGGVFLTDRRGWADFSFVITEDNVWSYQIDVRPHGSFASRETIRLRIEIDGIAMGTKESVSIDGQMIVIEGFTPFLKAGTHTLRLFHDNVLGRLSARIDGVRIVKPGGADLDGDGLADEVEALISDSNSLSAPTLPTISPVSLEGIERYRANLRLLAAGEELAINAGPDSIWYADVDLDPSGAPVPIQARFEGGAVLENTAISWGTTNVLAGGTLSLRVGDSLRLIGSPNSPPDPAATTTINVTVPGYALLERWNNIPGNQVANFTNDPRFPDQPEEVRQVNGLDMTPNAGDNYGLRLRGYITAPVSGNYSFWIASDGASQLLLSSTDIAADKVMIASTTQATNRYEWTKFASQQSAHVPLVEGNRYYFEILMKEWAGPDHLSVAWQIPGGGDRELIPASVLTPLEGHGDGATFTGSESEAHVFEFSQPHTYRVTATHVAGDQTVTTRTLEVKTLAASFGPPLVVRAGLFYPWKLPNVSEELTLEGGADVAIEELNSQAGPRTIDASAATVGKHYILARMPGTGAVVARGELEAMKFSTTMATGDFSEQTFADGDSIINFSIVADNLPPGGSVTIRVTRAGVTFLDGTTVKTFTAEDFSAGGVATVQLYFPEGTSGGYCHNITILDATGRAF